MAWNEHVAVEWCIANRTEQKCAKQTAVEWRGMNDGAVEWCIANRTEQKCAKQTAVEWRGMNDGAVEYRGINFRQ